MSNFLKDTFFNALSILLIFLLQMGSADAHPGGHYHHNDGTVFNVWTMRSGEIIKGNFSSGSDMFLIVEQDEGQIVKIPLHDLSAHDLQFAKSEIKRFERVNAAFTTHVGKQTQSGGFLPLTYYVIVLIIFCVLVFTFQKEVIQLRFSKVSITKLPAGIVCLLALSVCMFSFKKNKELYSSLIKKTSTAYIDSAFTPYKPAVATRWDSNYFYIASNGIPQHNMMVGISSWQQQVPLPQNYSGNNSWSIPLQPVYSDAPLSTKNNFMKGAVAIAVNGVPIFNALNNRGEDAYTVGELDNWGGHCGRADDYHYHAAPLHLKATSGLKPIAFALDGFAVYGDKEPDGKAMQPLDSCHGHFSNTSVYHYHGTTNYPYVIGAFKGVVQTDPRTPAPENQILPQAFAAPARPAGRPLRGATITSFTSTATGGYKLTYKIGQQFGFVEYEKLANDQYQFTNTDISGNKTTSSFQQKNRNKQ